MAVSEHDREVMRRIGIYKARSHAMALARHLSLSVSERLGRSWSLFLGRRSLASSSTRVDDPSAFYDRARALGLYRPRF